MKTITPLKSLESRPCILPLNHVKAMVKAMEVTGEFTIKTDYKDAGTVEAYHTRTNREVFAAIDTGDAWVIRHHKELFKK